MAALREILARFSVSFDDKELKKGDKAIDGVVGKLSGLGKMAGAAFGAFLGANVAQGAFALFDGIAEGADHLGDMAERFGISTDALQEWQYAAKLSGAEAEDMTAALARLQNAAGDSAASLSQLGIATKNASGEFKGADELLGDVAEAFEKIQNPTERVNKAMALFGRSGAKLVPLLSKGRKGVKELRKEFKDLGGGFSKETIEVAGKYKDSLDRLNVTWLSFKSRLGAAVLPLVEKFVEVAVKVVAVVNRWSDALKPIIDRSNILKGVAIALGVALVAAFAPALIAALPVVAAIAAIAIAADELITFFQGGDTVIGRALDSMFGTGTQGKVRAWFTDVYKTIAAFFGDTTKGWHDFKAGVELIWFDLTNAIRSNWITSGIVDMIMGSFDFLTLGVKSFVTVWGDAYSFVSEKIQGIIKAFETLGSAIGKIPGVSKILDFGGRALSSAAQAQTAPFAAAYGALQPKRDDAAIVSQRQAIIDSTATATVRAPGPQTVTDNSQITVNLPPGTLPTDAKRIAAEVAKAKTPSTKAMQNALVKTAG